MSIGIATQAGMFGRKVDAGSEGVTVALTDIAETGAISSSPHTFSSMDMGTAAADRLMLAVVHSRGSAATTGVSINGETATKIAESEADLLGFYAGLWIAAVSSDSSGDVVVTTGTHDWMTVGLYRLTGVSSTAEDFSEIASIATPVDTLAVTSGAVIVAAASSSREGGGSDWQEDTAGHEDYDLNTVAKKDTASAASLIAASTSITVEFSLGASQYTCMVAAAFPPV